MMIDGWPETFPASDDSYGYAKFSSLGEAGTLINNPRRLSDNYF